MKLILKDSLISIPNWRVSKSKILLIRFATLSERVFLERVLFSILKLKISKDLVISCKSYFLKEIVYPIMEMVFCFEICSDGLWEKNDT